ncbi:MAG: phenylalanine--tRNA ligase subunit beta [Candidatus Aenigmatarchaeota archaeon]
MALINVNTKDLLKLIGKSMPLDRLEHNLAMFGVVPERVTDKECELEVFPNRPDMLSVEGLARSFAGFIGAKRGYIEYEVHNSDYEVEVGGSTKDIRPEIVCAVVKNVKLTDELVTSIMQLQEKLHLTYCRKRAKASIGIYDLDSIIFPVTYKAEKPDFSFMPLDFKRKLTLKDILKEHPKGRDYGWIIGNMPRYPLLIDSKGTVLSMPPIINSEESKVTERTKNLFIDVTGTDKKTVNEVLNILVCALADRGGKVFGVKVSYPAKKITTPQLEPWKNRVSIDYVNQVLGLDINAKEAAILLERMRFNASPGKDGMIEVEIPPYRTDIMHPIDLVEDIAIMYGYDNIEPYLPEVATIGSEKPIEATTRKLRELMIGSGYQEVITYVLTSKENLFKKMGIKEEAVAETLNHKSEEYYACRNWLLPNIMGVLYANRHNAFPQKVFEIGDCITLSSDETGTKVTRRLCGAESHEKANLTGIKSVAEELLRNMGMKHEIRQLSHPSFIETRCGEIIINGKRAGFLGEVHPQVLNNFNIEMPVVAFEIEVPI